MEDKLYWYWFCTMLGINARKQHEILNLFQHPKELWNLSFSVMETTFSKTICKRWIESKDETKIQKQYDQMKKEEIEFLLSKEAAYPQKLKEIYDYPYGIFQKGQPWQEKDLVIAIVGSRHPDRYGLEIARNFAQDLAQRGIGVVSGMAKGIDAAAHWGALKMEGTTAGILGCGIDQIYPRDNHQLFYEMYDKQSVFSEYPMNVRPDAWRFPERNRLISGWSDGIVIVQAEKRSGSLITADCGLDQNKEIFAVPGPVWNSKHAGCHALIRQGAKLVESVDDILSEFPNFMKSSENISQLSEKCLANPEKKVYANLDLYPRHINEIMTKTGLNFQQTVEALFHLEAKGYIKQISHNTYIKNIHKR